jgi:hypothetical protein
MVNPFEKTPAEKEEDVLEMLNDGYSYSQILKECHVSPNTVSDVKKKYFGVDSSKSTSQISKETKALKLFDEGKKPLEVAVELDLATDYIFLIHERYQRLKGLEEFNRAYEHVKGNIPPFVHLFDLVRSLGMTPDQVASVLRYGNQLPQLQNIHARLNDEIAVLESRGLELKCEVRWIHKLMVKSKSALEYYNNQFESKQKELAQLIYQINTKKPVTPDLVTTKRNAAKSPDRTDENLF